MRSVSMKVGTLARKTGISVRTLHHYDEIGLLTPSGRTEKGHRVYDSRDIGRLQQILSLKQLGLSLDDVRTFLDDPECSPRHVIELHMAFLKQHIELQQRLYRRLESMLDHLQNAEEVSLDELIQILEVLKMHEQYYTQEQLKALEERARDLGEDKIRQSQKDWADLYEQVRAEKERGTDPTSEPVLRLARRAHELIQAFTGGDPGIAKSLNTMYRQEGPEKASRGMIDREIWDYFAPAMEIAGKTK